MKIAAVSDTHGMWRTLDYPKADVLVMAGDILANYDKNRHRDALAQLGEIKELNLFFERLKEDGTYKEIVLVAGNHDFAFQLQPKAKELVTNAYYLQDSKVEIDGVKFWGSPWQPWFWDWAFNFPNHNENFFRARAHARNCWEMIPDDTDVLVTHSPPLGILDQSVRLEKIGCQFLRERVNSLDHKLHIFGHAHFSYGKKVVVGPVNIRTNINAAACDENYKPTNPIQTAEVN